MIQNGVIEINDKIDKKNNENKEHIVLLKVLFSYIIKGLNKISQHIQLYIYRVILMFTRIKQNQTTQMD